jgi:hypothetical protein
LPFCGFHGLHTHMFWLTPPSQPRPRAEPRCTYTIHGPHTHQVLNRKSTVLNLFYTEDAVRKMRLKARGFHSLEQTEKIHILMSPNTTMPAQRDNKHFKPGTTMGSALLNIGAPADKVMWKLTVVEKNQLYGKDARTQSTDDAKSNYPVRNDGDIEPVNYWQMSPQLYEELLWRTNAKAVLDLCCCVDTLAVACLELGIMYAGVCFTPSGVALLKKRLEVVVFQKFLDESSPIYKPTLAQTVNKIHGKEWESNVAKRSVAKPV